MAHLGIIAPSGPAPAPTSIWVRIAALRQMDLGCLAPKFRAAVEAGVARANRAGLDVQVFETCRSDELQQIYYEQGASHAPTAAHSWHRYGLAVDIISRTRDWDLFPGGTSADPVWLARLEAAMKHASALAWGGDWSTTRKDYPHWQWHRCRASPSQLSIDAYARGGKAAVWPLVGAA